MEQKAKLSLWTKDYVFILLTTFCAAVVDMIFISILPIHVVDIGGTNAIAGAMITGLVAAGMITKLVSGRLMDLYGRRRILYIGCIMYAINIILYNFAFDIQTLFVLRIISGISQGLYFGSVATIVADIVPADRLIDGIGYFGIAASLAGAFAPMIGLAIFNSMGSAALFVFASVFAVIAAVLALLVKSNYVPSNLSKIRLNSDTWPEGSKIKDAGIFKFIELSIMVPALIAFFIMFGNSAVSNFLASCGVERGIEGISLFFTMSSIAMIIVRLFNGKLASKFGSFRVILVGMILLIAAYIIIAFSYGTALIIVAGILSGLGFGISMPLLNATIYDMVGPERRGVASSTYGLFGDAGNGIGASFWGATSQLGGYTLTYMLSSVCIVISALIHTFVLRAKIKPSAMNDVTDVSYDVVVNE